MAKINRFNGNLQAPASAALGTERTLFGTASQSDDLTDQFNADLLRGWGIVGPSDQPTLQDFNAMGFTLGQIHAYLHQMGVAEYNALQEYHLGSITNVAGVLYVSLVDNNVGNAPASSPTQWSRQTDHGMIVFSSAGITAWTVPLAMQLGIIKPKITVYGAGGGGGRSGTAGIGSGGGAGGGKSTEVLDLTAVPSVTVTVGAGGAGATIAGNQGSSGASSSFGAFLSSSGGEGGLGNSATNNAGGGTGIGSGGSINEGLGSGGASVGQEGGNGGGGGPRATQAVAPGNNGVSHGSGGSGARFGSNGGTGADGLVLIEW